MIERLEKISTELFKNALKTYTRNDVLLHKKACVTDVPELLSLFPNKGVGFVVRKKHWREGHFWTIKRTNYKVAKH